MLSRLIILAASVSFAAQPQQSSRISESIIQIGIVRQAGQLTLRPEGKFSAIDQRTGDKYELEPSKDYLLLAEGGRTLSLGDIHFIGQLRLIPDEETSAIQVGQKKYRGSLLIKSKNSATFTVINEVGIEDYLYGVVSAEMSPSWPPEALKAQAVVARTFALANLGKFRADGYDLSGDTASQSYAAVDKRSEAATKAVKDTQGQILTWKGQVLKAYFHSCCGGHTCNVGTMWGTPENAPKPLRGVSDRYCSNSPQFEWSAYFPNDSIVEALQKNGFPITKVKAVRVGQRDSASGYARTMKIRADRNWIQVRANDFRNWLGNRDFKSTKVYRIVYKHNGYLFIGKGFGHGVGLCQWGAKAMAERGKSYKSILHFYFPGASLETRDD